MSARYLNITCKQCGEEVSVPVAEVNCGDHRYLYVGMSRRTSHRCVPDEDATQALPLGGVEYEGDVE